MKHIDIIHSSGNHLFGAIIAFAAMFLSFGMLHADVLADLNGSWEFRFEEGKSIGNKPGYKEGGWYC